MSFVLKPALCSVLLTVCLFGQANGPRAIRPVTAGDEAGDGAIEILTGEIFHAGDRKIARLAIRSGRLGSSVTITRLGRGCFSYEAAGYRRNQAPDREYQHRDG